MFVFERPELDTIKLPEGLRRTGRIVSPRRTSFEKTAIFSIQTQHTLLLASFFEKEFNFGGHESSKIAKSIDLSTKNVSEALIMFPND